MRELDTRRAPPHCNVDAARLIFVSRCCVEQSPSPRTPEGLVGLTSTRALGDTCLCLTRRLRGRAYAVLALAPLGFRVFGPLRPWAFASQGLCAFGPLRLWAFAPLGLLRLWASAPLGFRAFGLPRLWAFALLGFYALTPHATHFRAMNVLPSRPPTTETSHPR